ncbi:hypothetical protein E2C01_092936 [Portunus trituberculatus]|uniref:Uncharacterized protein n=1 Tax=Portunus trituberculatus TaxID=210409 RepID=A0A5B7JZ94_PORTR|nr:hypothetical protein [Portunus trituberculatus]
MAVIPANRGAPACLQASLHLPSYQNIPACLSACYGLPASLHPPACQPAATCLPDCTRLLTSLARTYHGSE